MFQEWKRDDYQKKLWNGVHQEEENEVDLNVPGRTGRTNIHKQNNITNTVQTIQNTVNTSTHITKTPTHYKTHTWKMENKNICSRTEVKKKYNYFVWKFSVSINLSDTEHMDYEFLLTVGEYRILKISFANWNPKDLYKHQWTA